jgi:metal-responsive CopG/Arc/MetJ family transcriptional regulator
MAKKEKSEAIHVRLPKPIVEKLDAAAEEEYQSRSGMAGRIIMEWLKQWISKGKGTTKR